ncbi:hypothetical protein BaOVIS_028760 [Babesia ovis]|uniref:Uncharacterized protein n=1 Tax=Babesia ovis TaxID=5869 RepID=A0A9W5TEI6_BABOV|nr:hypothetical protein BaOVIS_028760 [Babesia ovis]
MRSPGAAALMANVTRETTAPEEIDLTADETAQHDVIEEIPDENSRHLRMHVAAVYETYCNFKAKLGRRFKERVMRFMRHDMATNVRGRNSGSGRDIEGGNTVRASDITYDSLIFKVTVILGFLLQFPVMWVAGSALFIATSNFKASTVKWGCLNIALTTLSIMYMVQQWQLRSARFLYVPTSGESIVFDTMSPLYPWESVILEKGRRIRAKEFTYKPDLLWEAAEGHLTPTDYDALPLGNTGKLVDPQNLKGLSSIYSATEMEMSISGYVQFGAVLSNTKTTQHDERPLRLNSPGKFPVVYNAHGRPIFDIGMRCVDADDKPLWIGVNATRQNRSSIESAVFYLYRPHSCRLTYNTTGSRPTVHLAYVKSL